MTWVRGRTNPTMKKRISKPDLHICEKHRNVYCCICKDDKMKTTEEILEEEIKKPEILKAIRKLAKG